MLEVTNNNTRAWVSEDRSILTLDSGVTLNLEKIGSRHQGEFVENPHGSLAVGTLEDGTMVEVQRCYLRELEE